MFRWQYYDKDLCLSFSHFPCHWICGLFFPQFLVSRKIRTLDSNLFKFQVSSMSHTALHANVSWFKNVELKEQLLEVPELYEGGLVKKARRIHL